MLFRSELGPPGVGDRVDRLAAVDGLRDESLGLELPAVAKLAHQVDLDRAVREAI